MKNLFKQWASLLVLILLVVGLTVATMPALAEGEETEGTQETQTVETAATPTPKPAATPTPKPAATSAPAVAPTSVKLSTSKTIKVPINSSITLNPVLTPANAATTYKWKTSKKQIATVANGVVTAKKVGTATITVTTANKKKSTVKIKVYDPYKPTSVKLDQKGTVRLALGDKLTLNATLAPATAQSNLKWRSSKKKVASVSGGVVTAKKAGTATITVTTRNKKTAKVKIKVYDPYKPKSIALDKKGTQRLMVGNGMQLTATMSPATAQSGLKWRSSNKRVAVVNSKGWVGGLAKGTATITVTTRNKKTAKVKIKVLDDGGQPIQTPAGYTSPYVIYACKNSHTIAIIARDSQGNWNRVLHTFPTGMGRNNVTDVGYYSIKKKERWHKWNSGYSPYATRLTVGIYIHGPIYKSKNMNTIRPSYYNCIGTDCSSGCLRTTCGCASWIYYNCPVGTMIIIGQNSRFKAPRPTKISKKATRDPTDPGSNVEVLVTSFDVNADKVSLNEGGTHTITPYNAMPANNSNGNKYTYTTSNRNVAKVSSSGVVTGVGAGTATILVVANDAYKASRTVTVTVSAAASSAKLENEAAPAVIPDDILLTGDQPDVEAETPDAAETSDEAEAASDGEIIAATETDEGAADEAEAEADAETVEETPDAAEGEIVAGAERIAAVDAEPTPSGEDDGLSFITVDVDDEITEIIFDEE